MGNEYWLVVLDLSLNSCLFSFIIEEETITPGK